MKKYDSLNPGEYNDLVKEYSQRWEEDLATEEWMSTTIEDIRQFVKLAGIYEDLTEEQFEEFCESILNRVHDDGYEQSEWYAVMRDRDDNDWGFGDFNLEKAKLIARDLGEDAYIAVIINGVCDREITREDGEWSE